MMCLKTSIRRRFEAGWHNYQSIYSELVDDWKLYEKFVGHATAHKRGKRTTMTANGKSRRPQIEVEQVTQT